MINTLSQRVAARHARPARLSNRRCCYADSDLDAILRKPDHALQWNDYQSLFTISRCTGTYEELVHFLPHALAYCLDRPDHGLDCITSLVYFISRELDHLKSDALAKPVVESLRHLFAQWTATFHVVHYDLAACKAKGWTIDHFDLVDNSELVRCFVDDLLRYKSLAGLAEELVASLAFPESTDIHSAWFLEFAYQSRTDYRWYAENGPELSAWLQQWVPDLPDHDDMPPFSRSASIVRLINNTSLIRRHYTRIQSTLVTHEPSPTYWQAVATLLSSPEPETEDPSSAPVPRFSVDDAEAFRPKS